MTQLSNEQLASIAHDYYLSDLNLADISQKYNLSRYLVDKALSEAKLKHIVQISIRHDESRRNVELEYYFKQLFNLKEAFILRKDTTKIKDEENLVRFAASQIENYLKQSHTVGLTWGTTSLDIINNFQEADRPDLNFVQLLGITVDTGHRKNPLVQQAAYKFNAKYQQFPAPLYCANPKLTELFKEEPLFKNLEKSYKKLDLVFTGIGTIQSIEENEIMAKQYAPHLLKNIDQDKIAGFIFGRPYTTDGTILDDINDHICGITQQEISKVPIRFVIEKNRFKADALLGALHTGLITHLVINEGIAERIVQKTE